VLLQPVIVGIVVIIRCLFLSSRRSLCRNHLLQ